MRFLIDASLPRSAGDLVRHFGHDTEDVRDIGLGTAADTQVARYAKQSTRALITADFDFGDVREYPPAEYFGLVVVERPNNATVGVVIRILERFLNEPPILANLSGRLVIVEADRIRIRPALPEVGR